MKQDTDGQVLPSCLWHGTVKGIPDNLASASEHGATWHVMDHAEFLDPLFDDDDEDQRSELDFQLRMAYGNIVFEAMRSSSDPRLAALAEAGLERLGDKVGILFATSDVRYAESRFGPAVELDLDADGFLLAIPDDNVRLADAWVLVYEAGIAFPARSAPSMGLR